MAETFLYSMTILQSTTEENFKETIMKVYIVAYYLGDMYHSYTIVASNEAEAIMNCLNRIPSGSKKIFKDFEITLVGGDF